MNKKILAAVVLGIVIIIAIIIGGAIWISRGLEVDKASSICIENESKKIAQNNIKFAQGSLLVSYENKEDSNEIKKLISLYGLKIKTDYTSLPLLEIEVPRGEELKWICLLEENPIIKYAELNRLSFTN